MKKTILLFSVLFALGAKAQIIEFEDPNFKARLISVGCDINGDGEISQEEAGKESVQYLDLHSAGIQSLQGIEYFVNAKTILCYENQFTTLDVSNLVNLQYLNCSMNVLLTSLNISGATALTQLDCNHQNLSVLDVSNNPNLEWLNCSSNQLTSLDISNNPNLEWLICNTNQLTSLDVSNNTNLLFLECADNQLTNLDVSNNINLTSLRCLINQLTSLDVSNNQNLSVLHCNDNQLVSLFIKNGVDKNFITVNSNSGYDFTNNPNLTFICVDENQLQELQDFVTTNNIGNNPTITSDCSLAPLEVLEIEDTSVLLHWQPIEAAKNVSTYNIEYRTVANTNWTLISNIIGTSYLLENLNPGTEYAWRLYPIGAADESPINGPNFTTSGLAGTQEISNTKISVYPNPVKDVLTIQSSEFKNSRFAEIYDLSGKLIKTFTGNSTDVSALQKGVYILNIDNQSVKFIKE